MVLIASVERKEIAVPVLFTATIFTSASLLFFVQPMFAKMVLPYLGGSPAVWTTAMLFFQTVLLLGYIYAHLSVRFLSQRAQVILHLCVWASALAFLPIAVPEGWRYDPERPAEFQALCLFAVGVGLPFAALSATAPLLQAWYARTGALSASDPYFMYGASNLGSLISLLAFPFVAEPLFGVGAIGNSWAVLYTMLGLGLAACGFAMRHGAAAPARTAPTTNATGHGWRQIALWLFLAFIPSSLMLSITSTVATDIGSFPLIWIIPLALYLLTFVFAFSGKAWPDHPVIEKLFLIFLIYGLYIFSGGLTGKLGWLPFGILISFFLIAALLSHRKLYISRPPQENLTIFYVTMSVGGALGGLFNSIVAPILFNDVYEGPITLVLSALLLTRSKLIKEDVSWFIGATILCALPMSLALWLDVSQLRPFALLTGVLFFLSFWSLRGRPLAAFATAAAILILGQSFLIPETLLKERSFFGTYSVRERDSLRVLDHGTTQHGAERLADTGQRPMPTSYYFPNAPMGRIMADPTLRGDETVGIVGLGVGALVCYRQGGQTWHLYEIDAIVDRIARHSGLFDFMPQCGGESPTHIGDARIVLEGQNLDFDILVIDSYSSDAIPIHLMTTEAVRLYIERLTDDGIVVFHISNRFFALEPVLARIARDLGLYAAVENFASSSAEAGQGAVGSDVVVFARGADRLARLAKSIGGTWRPLISDAEAAWTDDYSNLLGALR